MQRILIVGTSGSGKTTLATKLSQKISIPSYDLDEYHWLPNWQRNSVENFQAQVNSIIERPQWIISGNYQDVRASILVKADILIWLDYSLLKCLYQATLRGIKRAYKQESCCNGNYESLRQTFFSKQSLLLWIMKTHSRYKKEYGEIFTQNNHKIAKYVRFSKADEVSEWLKSIK